jgi:hypothetical protein
VATLVAHRRRTRWALWLAGYLLLLGTVAIMALWAADWVAGAGS